MRAEVGKTYKMKTMSKGHPCKNRTVVDADEDRVKSHTGSTPSGMINSEWWSRRIFEEYIESEALS